MYIEVAVSSRPVVSRDNVAPVPVVDAESILNRAEASQIGRASCRERV